MGFWDGSGISWTTCKRSTSLQTDNHTNTSSLNFLQAGRSSWRQTNSVKALKALHFTRKKANNCDICNCMNDRSPQNLAQWRRTCLWTAWLKDPISKIQDGSCKLKHHDISRWFRTGRLWYVGFLKVNFLTADALERRSTSSHQMSWKSVILLQRHRNLSRFSS